MYLIADDDKRRIIIDADAFGFLLASDLIAELRDMLEGRRLRNIVHDSKCIMNSRVGETTDSKC